MVLAKKPACNKRNRTHMLDTSRVASTEGAFSLPKLKQVIKITDVKVKEICEFLQITAKDWALMVKADAFPEKIAVDLALFLNVPMAILTSKDALEPVRMPGRVYNRQKQVDGYYGNVGIRIRPGQANAWFPISDLDATDIFGSMDESYGGLQVIPCLGASTILINTDNISAVSVLPEAGDAPDDWVIDPRDPVCGICPAMLEMLGICGRSDEPGAYEEWSSKAVDAMNDLASDFGGWDQVSSFLFGIEVHYANGTVEKIMDYEAVDSIMKLARSHHDEGEIIHGSRLEIEGAMFRFLRIDDIAYIRIPNLVMQPGCLSDFGR